MYTTILLHTSLCLNWSTKFLFWQVNKIGHLDVRTILGTKASEKRKTHSESRDFSHIFSQVWIQRTLCWGSQESVSEIKEDSETFLTKHSNYCTNMSLIWKGKKIEKKQRKFLPAFPPGRIFLQSYQMLSNKLVKQSKSSSEGHFLMDWMGRGGW